MTILERIRQACLKYNGQQKIQTITTCDFLVLALTHYRILQNTTRITEIIDMMMY